MAACLDIAVDLIEPMGFAFGDRALARAGMDYVPAATFVRHPDWAAFEARRTGRLVVMTTTGADRIDRTMFRQGDVLLFGSESAGVPPEVHDRADLRVRIPLAPAMRSLNVAVAAAIAIGEALRQLQAWPE